jgi:hypothetical protein
MFLTRDSPFDFIDGVPAYPISSDASAPHPISIVLSVNPARPTPSSVILSHRPLFYCPFGVAQWQPSHRGTLTLISQTVPVAHPGPSLLQRVSHMNPQPRPLWLWSRQFNAYAVPPVRVWLSSPPSWPKQSGRRVLCAGIPRGQICSSHRMLRSVIMPCHALGRLDAA